MKNTVNINLSALMVNNDAANYLEVLSPEELQIFGNELQSVALKFTENKSQVCKQTFNQIECEFQEIVLSMIARGLGPFSNRVKLDTEQHIGLHIRVLNPSAMGLPPETERLLFKLVPFCHSPFLPAIEHEGREYCLTQFEVLEGNVEFIKGERFVTA